VSFIYLLFIYSLFLVILNSAGSGFWCWRTFIYADFLAASIKRSSIPRELLSRDLTQHDEERRQCLRCGYLSGVAPEPDSDLRLPSYPPSR
jgi:hypothetical protein